MWLVVLLFILGLALIIKGGDSFIDAASWIAVKSGMPELIVGATIVSFATTLPEMLVSFFAVQNGRIDMAIGNVIGSTIVNVGMILGIAVLFMPAKIERGPYLVKFLLLLAAVAVLFAFSSSGALGLLPCILLAMIFFASLGNNLRLAKKAQREMPPENEVAASKPKEKASRRELAGNGVKFVLGAAAVVVGSHLLVDNAIVIAERLGVPERVIAITVMALGTSLPELVTAISAIVKKQSAMSIGNIVGATTIALTFVLPVSTMIAGQPLPVSRQFFLFDIPATLILCLVAFVPTLVRQRFSRLQGGVLLAGYTLYLGAATYLL